MGNVRSMVTWWKSSRIFVFVIFILGIVISGSLLSSGYERHLPAFFIHITSEPNFTVMSQEANVEMPTSQMLKNAQTSSLTLTTKSKPTKRPWPPGFFDAATAKAKGNERTPLTLSNVKRNLPKFNESFRNPCWYDRYNNVTTLRCFPYFYLAGFPKCSTTDLYHRLMGHPLVIAGVRKGTHYFTRSYFNTTLQKCSSNFDCASVTFSNKYFTRAALMIYMTSNTKFMNSAFLETGRMNSPSFSQVRFIEAFPHESTAIWKEGQKFNKYPGIIGDGSPSTVWDHHNFRLITDNQGYDFPRNFSADWIRTIYPDTKIIMILRDPVARAFSDYMMYVKSHRVLPSANYFHIRVQETLNRINECLARAQQTLLCTTYTYRMKLEVGMYYYYIKAWFEKFRREQILFLRYEDYAADMPKTLAKVFKFLGLPAVSQEGLEFMSKSEPLNVSKFKNKQMPEKTKVLLTKFYKPFNKKLAELLGDDRFLWN